MAWGTDGPSHAARDEPRDLDTAVSDVARLTGDLTATMDARNALQARIDAALALHTEGTFDDYGPWDHCKTCCADWPCPTVRALTGEAS